MAVSNQHKFMMAAGDNKKKAVDTKKRVYREKRGTK
jgi:hypothetical protein